MPVDEDWVSNKETHMYNVLYAKFSNEELREKLLATGSEDLINANQYRDEHWGTVYGKGKNRLGVLLRKVRSNLKSNEVG